VRAPHHRAVTNSQNSESLLYLAKSIAPLLASAELTIPSNFARGLYIDTVGLLGGTGGAFFARGYTPIHLEAVGNASDSRTHTRV